MMEALGARPLLTGEEMGAIENEILILLGDRDDMASREYSETVAGLLPNARFLSLPDTPHPIEKTDLEMLAGILVVEFSPS